MNRRILSLAVIVPITLGLGVGTAVAVGDAPAPTAGQTLSDYMGDGNAAQWDKVQTWVESEYGEGATATPAEPEPTQEPSPEPEPTTDPEPTAEPTQEPEPVTPALGDHTVVATDDNFITFDGTVTGYEGPVTFRVSAYELTGQAGYPIQGNVGADGKLTLSVEDFNNTDPQYWQLEQNGSTNTYGEIIGSGTVGAPAPAPEPTTEPVVDTADWSNLRDTTFTSWEDSQGITSQYHIWSNHVDTSKKVGLLVYGDGSGEHGLENPDQNYLIGGTNGLLATAKKHNMILVTPLAPGDNCTDQEGDCWYGTSNEGITPSQKTDWSGNLVQAIQAGLPGIDKSRVAIGGYSSGAQWASQFFGPRYADNVMTDGVIVPISYGGAPRVTSEYTQSIKDNVVFSWDTGDQDTAYGTQSWQVLGGKEWYDNNGFITELNVEWGEDHYRSGQFGAIMDREISEHVKPA